MDRESDEHRKRGKATKAKLDSKGRPIVEAAPAPKADDKREDQVTPVRAVARLGALVLFALAAPSTGCDVAARAEPDPALVAAVNEAKAAAEQAREHEAEAKLAAEAATKALNGCTEAMNATTDLVVAMRKDARFGSAHGGR